MDNGKLLKEALASTFVISLIVCLATAKAEAKQERQAYPGGGKVEAQTQRPQPLPERSMLLMLNAMASGPDWTPLQSVAQDPVQG
jgi:hypothetical protein